jgi:predicted transcriptional regulator of viral defense system
MKSPQTLQQKLIYHFKRKGVIRPRDLDAFSIPREILQRLCQQGQVERFGHGLYRLPMASTSEHYTLAAIGKAVPTGVVCLMSALRFHNLTTQAPHEVWIAIDVKAYAAKLDMPVRFVRFSGAALHEGVGNHKVDHVRVKVYNVAKTVADCFKYRNKIGLDVALEALRESQRTGACSIDELWYYAKICRVSAVIRPYLEAMTQ